MKRISIRCIVIFAIVISHLFIIVCEKNPSESENTPPVMPPQESMMIDLSNFSVGGNQSLNKSSLPQAKTHFGLAVLTLGLVNISVMLHLTVPVYIFGRALLEKPELQSDGKFHWTYSTVYQLFNYEADLAGWVDVSETEVNWEMYVTQAKRGLDHYRWYDGHCNLDATAGDWTFYDASQPDQQNPVIQINWQIQSETDRSLVFANIFEGDENIGDQLIYQIDGDSARVQYLDASEGTTAKIVWNTETIAGYIQAPNYNEGKPGRWDENQEDMN
ncbi:hypothetical protein JW835_16890 [bacterium]|nr:hypothetical protein [bacterium]